MSANHFPQTLSFSESAFSMLRFPEKLSPRLKFCLGFVCCPLISWFALAFIILVALYTGTALEWLPQKLSSFALVFIILSALVFLLAVPAFSGFSASFFWRNLSCARSNESTAGFWSVALSWLPVVIFFPGWPLLFFPFLVFLGLYTTGLGRGVEFWNSNRPRQWLGDFSDLGPPDAR